METTVLRAQPRTKLGTKYTRRVRQSGDLPAIIYGHGEAPEAVSLPTHDVLVELSRGSRVLQVNLSGKDMPYLIKSVQYDHLGTHPVHLDLMRVDLNERVRVMVGIELRGTPKGVKDGGVLDQLLANVEVECLIHQIPNALPAPVAGLGIGDSLLIRDLKMPEGVVACGNPDDRIAMVRTVMEEKPAEAAAEGPAEPEVISRGKAEEEEGAAEA